LKNPKQLLLVFSDQVLPSPHSLIPLWNGIY